MHLILTEKESRYSNQKMITEIKAKACAQPQWSVTIIKGLRCQKHEIPLRNLKPLIQLHTQWICNTN